MASSRALLALLAITVLAWIAWAWLDIPSALTWAQGLSGPIPALFLVPLQIAISLSFSPIPSDVVGIALCVVYGFMRGSALVWFGWMIAAWIEYTLVRRIAGRVDENTARGKLPGWLRHLPVEHPGFLICGRWFPLGPHLVNSAAGAARISIWRFTWTAAVGIAPVALLVGAVAAGLLAAGADEAGPPAHPPTDRHGIYPAIGRPPEPLAPAFTHPTDSPAHEFEGVYVRLSRKSNSLN
ncbi:MAG: VTT domain-containing protein [Candidatus Binatia bacterium]|nr:VTT domain-containing protein [Candidatus Binatia bacterium]